VGLEELKPIKRRDHPMKINIPEGTESLWLDSVKDTKCDMKTTSAITHHKNIFFLIQ